MKLDKKKLRLILTIIAAIIVVGYVIKNMRTAENPGSTTAGFETIDPDETTKATEAPETEAPTTEAEKTEPEETEADTTEATEESVTETEPEKTTESTERETEETTETTTAETEDAGITVKKGKSYTDKDHVALYIHLYGELPPNFITKKEAEKLGWKSQDGYLGDFAPGKSIGGTYFGNYEGQLPKKKGRSYYECDIDYKGKKRNAKRIIYSDDGLVYYTDDHYETFELLYGEE